MPDISDAQLLEGLGPTRRCTRCNVLQFENRTNFRWLNGQGRWHPHCRACERETRRAQPSRGPRRVDPVEALGINRRFGVEIEFWAASRTRAVEALRAAGLRVHNGRGDYNNPPAPYWRMKSDGSLNAPPRGNLTRGLELVSPPLQGEEGLAEAKLAFETLVAHGVKVNKKCGLHVHLEVRDVGLAGIKKFVRAWYENQSFIDWLVSPSRRVGCFYASHLSSYEVVKIERARRITGRTCARYRAVNVTSFPKHGTLEIRQHQGTLDYRKFEGWLRLAQGLLDTCAQAREPLGRQQGLRHFLTAILPVGDRTQDYLYRRARRFGYREEVAA